MFNSSRPFQVGLTTSLMVLMSCCFLPEVLRASDLDQGQLHFVDPKYLRQKLGSSWVVREISEREFWGKAKVPQWFHSPWITVYTPAEGSHKMVLGFVVQGDSSLSETNRPAPPTAVALSLDSEREGVLLEPPSLLWGDAAQIQVFGRREYAVSWGGRNVAGLKERSTLEPPSDDPRDIEMHNILVELAARSLERVRR